MIDHLSRYHRPNPFATRYVRPGAIEYLFAPGASVAQLVERLAGHAWRGQIVGPHGVGKSTLLATLIEPLRAAGQPPHVIALHDGERRLPGSWTDAVRATGAKLLIVDGYEQLGRIGRWRLRHRCRRAGWGLLVTAHRDVGLPTVALLVPSLPTAQRVVERLLGHRDLDNQVAEAFDACRGNLRETLFRLYDHFEHTRRCAAAAAHAGPARQVSDCAGRADFSV